MRQNEIMEAYLDDYDTIAVYIHEQFYQGKSESFYLKDRSGAVLKLNIRSIARSGYAYCKYRLDAPKNIIIGYPYQIIADYSLTCPLCYGYVVRTERFDREFYYDGNDLGIHYTPQATYFNVWAPTASAMQVELHQQDELVTVAMKRTDRGVYRGVAHGDLDGAAYTYLIYVNGKWNEAVDPYGRSHAANKKYGYIVDPAKCIVPMRDECLPPFSSYTDAVIYETHVRDFTKQFTNDPQAGTFLGVVETGLRTPNGKPAGFDYVRDLGITHLQLQPIADYTTVDEENVDTFYNWGYDPGHYNCPEGSYASNPNDPYSRILECKQMIAGLHQAGIRVIMDVVYNHMHSMINSDFEKIVPHYFFRLSADGSPSNGSFCGNDFDSTRMMSRKFIVDSISMWMKEYHVDGFRFDLMGILDVETMNQIAATARSINPAVFLHGEGWNMPTILPDDRKASLQNQSRLPRIGQFNDFFREHVKGKSSEHEVSVKGFCTGDMSYKYAIPACLSGCVLEREGFVRIFDSPEKSTNYVECHDNGTVWDKMKTCCAGEENGVRMQRQKMMIGMVLVSQGVPFLHSGQEFCRSKQGVQNSYASSDLVNRLDWDRKDKYQHVSQYTKDMIALRKQLPALRMRTQQEIEEHASFRYLEQDAIEYRLHDVQAYGEYEDIRIVINPAMAPLVYRLDEPYLLLADGDGLVADGEPSKQFTLDPLSVSVLVKP